MQVNKNAPVVQRNQIYIKAAPEKVWAVLTDIQDWPSWNPKITAARLETPLAEGGKFVWKINGATIKSTLHTFDSDRSLGWQGSTFGATAIHNWFLENRDGGTLVRVEESMEGWLVGLFRGKMNRDLAKDMLFWLEALKRRSEG